MLLSIQYPSFLHPEIIPGFPLLRWYALMYLVAFGIAYFLFKYQVAHNEIKFRSQAPLVIDDVSSFFLYGIVGLLLGARIGSCLIYDDTLHYLLHPWLMFWPFDEYMNFVGLAGMSYHGGFIGGFIGMLVWCIIKKREILPLFDGMAASIPLGYTFGRFGNFFNGELYGRITTSPIGMIFPQVPIAERFDATESWVRTFAEQCGIVVPDGAQIVNLPRHPSQLYEALFEGLILWLIIWLLRNKKPFQGFLSVLYTFGYAFFRFFIEYFRQPDANIGFRITADGSQEIFRVSSLFNISTGQILCLVMMLGSLVAFFILWRLHIKQKNTCTDAD